MKLINIRIRQTQTSTLKSTQVQMPPYMQMKYFICRRAVDWLRSSI